MENSLHMGEEDKRKYTFKDKHVHQTRRGAKIEMGKSSYGIRNCILCAQEKIGEMGKILVGQESVTVCWVTEHGQLY